MRRIVWLLPFVLTALLSLPAHAEKRVALVIGNGSYAHAGRLANPVNDANDIAAFLKTLQFDVVLGHDLPHDGMRRVLRDFRARADQAQIALFFYAGHGMQVGGTNVLIPVDAKLEDELDIEPQTMRLDAVMTEMERAASVNIVLLDACRNNPLAERLMRSIGGRSRAIGLTRGLAPVSARTVDTLIMFATEPGSVADDGVGRNSPFTAAIMRHLGKADEVSLLLKDVVADVRGATKGKQRPQQLAAMERKLYLAGEPKRGPDSGEAERLRAELDRLKAEHQRIEEARRKADADRARTEEEVRRKDEQERRKVASQIPPVAVPAPAVTVPPSPQPKPTPMSRSIRLQLQTAFPENMPIFSAQAARVGALAKALSGGRLESKVYSAGTLVPALEVANAVSSGVLDGGWWPSVYSASKNSAFVITGGGVPFGLPAGKLVAWIEGEGGSFHARAYKTYEMQALPCAISGQEGAWYRKELRTLGDLRGLKLRWLGLSGQVWQKLGASIVIMPGGELVPALERGVIDGLEFSVPKLDAVIGFEGGAKYYYHPGWHQPATLIDLIVSKKAWQELAAEGQAALASACQQLLKESLDAIDLDEREGLKLLRDKGVQVRDYPPAIIDALRNASDELLAAESAKNPLFKAMLESYRRYQ
jgi:TRAP-type mannitol/chloroaromatic compound transport system substrate-binding protein/uncharacterized caspase-like protein